MDATIRYATEIHEQHILEVIWDNNDKHCYPYIWLRDNCPCRTICWDASGTYLNSNAKLNINVEIKPISIEINAENSVSIEWSDGHQSEYLSDWLLKYTLEESADECRNFSPNIRYWNADDIASKVRKFDFQDLLTKDEVLLNWITDLRELGIAFVANAPKKPDQLMHIGKRIKFLQSCHYGMIWKIETRRGPTKPNAGYNTDFLPLHTDLNYYQRPPGILMLHCIKAAEEGGVSILSDGFKVAEDLRREHPEEFKLLTTTAFENFGRGIDENLGKYYYTSTHPVIRLTPDNKIDSIATGQHSRTPRLQTSPSKVLPVYRALKLFHDKLHDKVNMYQYKLQEGDIVCMNNYRILHGREAFKSTRSCHRYLEGSYLDWDQVNSRARVLYQQMDSNNNGDVINSVNGSTFM